VYNPQEDVVVLDGIHQDRDWPLAIAEQLLTDPTPWSTGYRSTAPTQWHLFSEVASFVNWSNRRRISPKVAVERLRQNEPLDIYSTQELLDMLSAIWRMHHHVGAGFAEIEPALRVLLGIIVTRVRSTTPPRFQFPR
jgi:hypothetical protein